MCVCPTGWNCRKPNSYKTTTLFDRGTDLDAILENVYLANDTS